MEERERAPEYEALRSVEQRIRDQTGDSYGYAETGVDLEALRSTEYAHVGSHVYLDHAGAPLFSSALVREAAEATIAAVPANPHSQHALAQRTADVVESFRREVLAFCGLEESQWACVWTSGATAALKLVGEGLLLGEDTTALVLHEDSHSSALGMRGFLGLTRSDVSSAEGEERSVVGEPPAGSYAVVRGARAGEWDGAASAELRTKSGAQERQRRIFVISGESNATGQRYAAGEIAKMRSGHVPSGKSYTVVLDAAKLAASAPLAAHADAADFVILSLYKILGYPTGLGALLVRRSAPSLRKVFFGGGTVAASAPQGGFVIPRSRLEERLEDGTVPFHTIIAARIGLKALCARMPPHLIDRHTFALAKATHSELERLQHANGRPVCVMVGSFQSQAERGGTVAFSVQTQHGAPVGYAQVETIAAQNGICLRGGCHCNPGACMAVCDLSLEDVKRHHAAGHVCWDAKSVIQGRNTGFLRASFGAVSTGRDAAALVSFIASHFCATAESSASTSNTGARGDLVVAKLTLYPIKSCGGVDVDSWPLQSNGLLLDRSFQLEDVQGRAITQKRCPQLCRVRCRLLERGAGIGIRVDGSPGEIVVWASGDERDCGDDAAAFLTERLGMAVRLVRGVEGKNSAPLLLVTEESVADLRDRMRKRGVAERAEEVSAGTFRPNIVLRGSASPYAEETWTEIAGENVSLGGLLPCQRCIAINVRERDASRHTEPLRTLASYRLSEGKDNPFLFYERSTGRKGTAIAVRRGGEVVVDGRAAFLRSPPAIFDALCGRRMDTESYSRRRSFVVSPLGWSRGADLDSGARAVALFPPRAPVIAAAFLTATMQAHEYARTGDVEQLRAFLAQDGRAVARRDKFSRTPLHLAAWSGNASCVEALLQAGAAVDDEARDGVTAVMFAAQNGHLDVVKVLCQHRANLFLVNKKNHKGPLHLAAEKGHVDIVSFLARRKPALVRKKAQNGKLAKDLAKDDATRSACDVTPGSAGDADEQPNIAENDGGDAPDGNAATKKGSSTQPPHDTESEDGAGAADRSAKRRRGGELIYHLVEDDVWGAVKGDEPYYPAMYEKDGFIHATKEPERLVGIANHFYRESKASFLCLEIDTSRVDAPVKFEAPAPVGDAPPPTGDEAVLFPHIYGGLRRSAVVRELAVERGEDGSFLRIQA